MTKRLQGKSEKGLWGKVWNGVKAVFVPQVYQADRIAETQRDNTERVIESNQQLEKSRQAFRKAELELQESQRRDNLFFQAEQNKKNRELQVALAEFNRQTIAFEGKQNRQLQAYLAELNREAVAYEGRMNRQLQAELAELNRMFQANEGKLNREHSLKLELFRANLQKWMFEQQKALQLQLKQIDAEIARELRLEDRKTVVVGIRERRQLDNLPICLLSEQILDSSDDILIPLRIFFSPPHLHFNRAGNPNDIAMRFSQLEIALAEQAFARYLHTFFEKYSFQNRPIEFFDGAWTNANIRNYTAVRAMFYELKTEPVIILESLIQGLVFDLRFAFWGVNWAKPRYKIANSLSWLETLYDFTKIRTLRWKEKQDSLGKNEEEIKRKFGSKIVEGYLINLEIIKREKQCIEDGDDPSDIFRSYVVSEKDYENLCQFLATIHCLIAGLLADEYFLVHVPPQVRQRPLLPTLLPELLKDVPEDSSQEFIEIAVEFYKTLYEYIEQSESNWIPELRLDLALSLFKLDNKEFAKEQVLYSITTLLRSRGYNDLKIIADYDKMAVILDSGDENYFNKVDSLLRLMDRYFIPEAEEFLDIWFRLVREGHIKRKKYGITLYDH